MGTDNLKNRAKSTSQLKRQKGKRTGDLILIVCEGSKTEPYYIEALIKDYEIPKAKAEVEVTGECGSDPLSIVNFAIKKLDSKNYDYIFCVIDRDKHPNFNDALQKINMHKWETGKKSEKFKVKKAVAIVSIPCFEYWLILHFQKTTRPFVGNGQSISPCKDCITYFKSISGFTDYEKGNKDLYTLTKIHINTAINNSKKIISEIQESLKNPSTNFHDLVEFLINFKA